LCSNKNIPAFISDSTIVVVDATRWRAVKVSDSSEQLHNHKNTITSNIFHASPDAKNKSGQHDEVSRTKKKSLAFLHSDAEEEEEGEAVTFSDNEMLTWKSQTPPPSPQWQDTQGKQHLEGESSVCAMVTEKGTWKLEFNPCGFEHIENTSDLHVFPTNTIHDKKSTKSTHKRKKLDAQSVDTQAMETNNNTDEDMDADKSKFHTIKASTADYERRLRDRQRRKMRGEFTVNEYELEEMIDKALEERTSAQDSLSVRSDDDMSDIVHDGNGEGELSYASDMDGATAGMRELKTTALTQVQEADIILLTKTDLLASGAVACCDASSSLSMADSKTIGQHLVADHSMAGGGQFEEKLRNLMMALSSVRASLSLPSSSSASSASTAKDLTRIPVLTCTKGNGLCVSVMLLVR
jgi:hypothetical protein